MTPVDRWSDDRLDELNRRVVRMEDVTTTVAVIQTEQAQMKQGLGRVEKGVDKLTEKIGQVVDEPLVRARDFRKQVIQGGIIALISGGCVFAATVLAGVIH